MASKKRPVPAAQRSFIANSSTRPLSSTDITLQSWPPMSTTVRVLEENLAIIDRAIADARTALEQDPASRYLNGHLGRTLRRKVDLLQRAATLVTAAS